MGWRTLSRAPQGHPYDTWVGEETESEIGVETTFGGDAFFMFVT